MKNSSQKPDFFGKLSLHARHILQASFELAERDGSVSVTPHHLLIAIVLEKKSLGSTLLAQFGITEKTFATTHNTNNVDAATPEKHSERTWDFSEDTRSIIARAFLLAHRFSYPYVGSEHFVHAIAESKAIDLDALRTGASEVNREETPALSARLSLPELPGFSRLLDFPALGFAPEGDVREGETPALDQFGIPLPSEDSSARFSLREKEMESVIRTLSRKTKSNPLLIGDPGVGKTAIVEAIARLIQEGKACPALEGKRIVLLDLASVVAGTSFRGEFESRLKDIVRETKEHPEIILFLDEIHTIVGAGNASGSLDASNILKPALARGDIRCIGATTFAEYKRHIEKDPALERRFQVIKITEPTPEESARILRESRESYERHHRLTISDDAIEAAVNMSVRHLPARFLPDKAFDLLDEAAALLRQKTDANTPNHERTGLLVAHSRAKSEKERFIREQRFEEAQKLRSEELRIRDALRQIDETRERLEKKRGLTLSGETVKEAASLISGTPIERISGERIAHIGGILPALSKTIRGQNEALETLARALTRSFLGLGKHTGRPHGSFLFLGPSGVGKTLTAHTLSDVLFDGKRSFIRFDMSEFRERHHMAQMLGSPAGYVGYGEGGTLTEHMRRYPSSVVLFDEIEKAHPDILNILLQILEDGILTDAEGRRAHFSESVVILTSNIGTSSFGAHKKLGFGGTAIDSFEPRRDEAFEALRREIRPELLSRLDHTIVFRPLDDKALEEIAEQEMSRLADDVQKHGIRMVIPKGTARFIAERAHADSEGARSIRKHARVLIEDPIASLLVSRKRFPKTIRFALTKNSLQLKP